MLLEPEYLDRIYTQWKIQDRLQSNPDYVPSYWDRRCNYQREYRSNFNNQRFENWLYSQGFTVVQQDGKRYLKFSGEEKRLTWFLLKHSVT